jgi:hypothetical protein
LGEAIGQMVPHKINKLYMIGNEMSDFDLKNLLAGLCETEGLHTISIM